jgi:hypothetical protein
LALGLAEHLSDVGTVGLRKLTGYLTCPLGVENSLHRIQHIAGILCCSNVGQSAVVMYKTLNQREFRFKRLLGSFDAVDSLVALAGQISEIAL